MNKTDYLLKYVSCDCYNKILKYSNDYIISGLMYSRIDVDLNIRYLIDIGIKNLDAVIYDRLEDLIKSHNEFSLMIDGYINSLGKNKFISMLENL